MDEPTDPETFVVDKPVATIELTTFEQVELSHGRVPYTVRAKVRYIPEPGEVFYMVTPSGTKHKYLRLKHHNSAVYFTRFAMEKTLLCACLSGFDAGTVCWIDINNETATFQPVDTEEPF